MKIIKEGINGIHLSLHEGEGIYYITLLLKDTKLFVLRYDTMKKLTQHRIDESVVGILKFHTEVLPDTSLLCHILSTLDKRELKMTQILFPKIHDPQEVTTYSDTIIGDFSEITNVRMTTGLKYRNVGVLIQTENMFNPYIITVNLLNKTSIITAQFISNEQTSKTLQIWDKHNPLIACSTQTFKESHEHLESIGIALEDVKEVVIESILRNGNYQIIKEAIIKKGIDGIENFKFVADYINTKFMIIKKKLSFDMESGIIEQFIDLVEPSTEYNVSEIEKDVKFLKLTLADCKSELRGYVSIFNAIRKRLEAGSEANKDCLGLVNYRERDQSSIEYVNNKILLFQKYESIAQLLLWTLDHSELICLDLTTLESLFNCRAKTRRLIKNNSKTFGEMIFEQINSKCSPIYPLKITQLIKLSLESKDIEAVHYMFLYTLFDAYRIDAKYKILVDSYIQVQYLLNLAIKCSSENMAWNLLPLAIGCSVG